MRIRSIFAIFGILVLLLLLTILRLPFMERARQSLGESFLPFLELSSRARGSADFLLDRFKQYGLLQAENAELRKRLGELSTRVAQVSELERENRDFRAMLDFRNRTELKLVLGKVIGRDPSNWWNMVIIDRGLDDGITRDMPVLTVEGLVGKTIEVTKTNARVLLVVDENCKVSGWLKESGQYGIVQGNALSGGSESQCRMIFVDRFSEVKPNDKVFTSGLGGIFPKGIQIGTVTVVHSAREPGRSTLYQEVNVRPSVDLARIDEVFIGVGVKPASKPSMVKSKGGR